MNLAGKIVIGFIITMFFIGIVLGILSATGVIKKSTEEKTENSNPSQNNTSDVNLVTQSEFDGNANASQTN